MFKAINLLFLPLFLCCSTLAASGVQFMEGQWTDALAAAQQTEKLIFLDAYTDWCVPCKKMDKDVFSQSSVGTVFNEQFINVKINMEKGEGRQLAKQYNIFAYPSLMFIAPDGSMVHRVAGYQNVDQMLDQAKVALDPDNRLAALQRRFEEGYRDPVFLKTLTKMKFKAVDGGHVEVAEAYMESQENMKSSKNMDFVYSYVTDTDSKLFDFLLEHRSRFAEMYGSRRITKKIQDLIFSEVEDVRDESSLEQIDKLYQRVYPQQAAQLSSNFRMNFYRQIGDYEKYARQAVSYVDQFGANGDQLNDIAYTFYEKVDDRALLKQAIKWVKKSIKGDSNYFNHDTLAALYYKTGKAKKAKKLATKALAMAEVEGHDASTTMKLLDMIEYDQQ
ncbi:MAG: thioredoxin family protein [Bacteroidota bacterium]